MVKNHQKEHQADCANKFGNMEAEIVNTPRQTDDSVRSKMFCSKELNARNILVHENEKRKEQTEEGEKKYEIECNLNLNIIRKMHSGVRH